MNKELLANIRNILIPTLASRLKKTNYEGQGEKDAIEFTHDITEIFDLAEQQLSAQPGWIPVTERLPRPNEEDGNGFYKAYLVQDGRWMDVARWDGEYWIAWGYSTVLLNVVAWMPLPSPWEGGEE